jgi:predicted nuclease of predicted toxin-antitoxin system
MKICVDENIPLVTVSELEKLGHDVLDIRSTRDKGIADDRLWIKVQEQSRLLITTDKGFASYRRDPHHGILIVRLRQPNEAKIHERVMQAIHRFTENDWPGLIVVMRDVIQSTWRQNEQ